MERCAAELGELGVRYVYLKGGHMPFENAKGSAAIAAASVHPVPCVFLTSKNGRSSWLAVRVSEVRDMERCAAELGELGVRYVYLKGGHMPFENAKGSGMLGVTTVAQGRQRFLSASTASRGSNE
jgi:hydroxymethylpyrimidine/phosphomethylpyrimidine kinase